MKMGTFGGKSCSPHVREEAESEKGSEGIRYCCQGHAPSELLLPTRPHLLKFLKIETSA
jgi:hypothetical protein